MPVRRVHEHGALPACLRGLARVAASAALLVAVLAGGARAQMSPGPLAAPHASLDSPLSCFQCHAQGDRSEAGMDRRCLACHGEIAAMKAARRGLHASPQQPCAKCHPDHGGRAFPLVEWDGGSPERFEHSKAGWELRGKHAQVKCRDCHQPRNQKSPVVARLKRKDRAASWLGLETACASCHGDPHRAQLGADCTKCHDLSAWKPAPGFDHAKTSYPLTGAHAKVECMKCHGVGPNVKRDVAGKLLAQWKPLPAKECTACHKDPHANRFGGACAKCHVTESFSTIQSAGVDHSLTRYPLKGAHAAVKCAQCHDEKTAFGPKPKFGRCADCHADVHAGKATLAAAVVDCASCHDVKAFAPSTYTAAQHQKSPYPLEGAHAAAKCEKCHTRAAAGSATAELGKARVQLRPAKAQCVDCHHDPHGGRFAATSPASGARPRACRDCHTMRGFRPSTYDEVAHKTCAFVLAGAHRATPCQACHAELQAPVSRGTLRADAASMRTLRFEATFRVCADCHTSPHGEQFAERRDRGACEACHGVEAFTPASKFVHDRDSAYKLEGAHARAACVACHAPQAFPDGKTRIVYRPLPTTCEGCHGVITPAIPETSRSSSAISPDRPAHRLLATHEVHHVPTR